MFYEGFPPAGYSGSTFPNLFDVNNGPAWKSAELMGHRKFNALIINLELAVIDMCSLEAD